MRAWIHHIWNRNGRWIVIAITLSLGGALIAWLIGQAGSWFPMATPSYQPKDEERRLHLERLEQAPQGEQPRSPSR